MEQAELDKWWSSLTTAEKERIASKIKCKELGCKIQVYYPYATQVWQAQSLERQNEIYRHCTDKHGLLLPEWKEGKSMSY